MNESKNCSKNKKSESIFFSFTQDKFGDIQLTLSLRLSLPHSLPLHWLPSTSPQPPSSLASILLLQLPSIDPHPPSATPNTPLCKGCKKKVKKMLHGIDGTTNNETPVSLCSLFILQPYFSSESRQSSYFFHLGFLLRQVFASKSRYNSAFLLRHCGYIIFQGFTPRRLISHNRKLQ